MTRRRGCLPWLLAFALGVLAGGLFGGWVVVMATLDLEGDDA